MEPHYIIDAERLSTATELKTMRDIKTGLLREYPHLADRFRPVRLTELSDVPENSRISEAFARLRDRIRIGGQYRWLARYCDAMGISDMELCIHHDDRAHALLQPFVEAGRVRPAAEGTDEWALFHYFHFPVFELSKLQMAALAEHSGWQRWMDMTWFCHRPRPGGVPCGVCAPCTFTIDEGLAHRLPFPARCRAWVKRARNRLAAGRTRTTSAMTPAPRYDRDLDRDPPRGGSNGSVDSPC